MKRMYIALVLVVISIIIGIVEFATVNYISNQCISDLKTIESEIDKNNLTQAEKLCYETTEEYKNFTENIIYCFYQHSNLEHISQNLSEMTESIKIEDIKHYKALSVKTKEQLQAIKDEELFTIQNIL